MGHAFATSEVEAEGGLLLGAMQADGATVSVRKNWRAVVGGGALLEESVGLIELARLLETLPKQARAERAASRAWRTARVESAVEARPVAVAYAPYQPKGVWVDFELNGSTNSYTFAMGQTYYIRTNFTVGPGTATFQPGCTVKLNTNAYVLVYGPVAFANTLQTPVFTSSRDDAFGEDIDGSPGSVPDYDAYAGLWVYYNDNGTIIQDARFRWAKTAVRYDGYPKTHYLGNSLLERCQTGVYVSSSIQLYTWGLEKHALQADFAGPGTNQVSGTMSQAPFYTDKSFAGLESNGRTVADTMGGIGSSEFLEVTTRAKIAVFNRTTGVRTEEQWLNQFFGVPEATDPRVWFDNASSTGPRWIVSAMYYAGKQALLKVSLTSSPSLASNWRSTYVINIPAAGDETIDFPTLGVDTNGIFLSVQKRNNLVNRGYSIQAFAKPTVYTDPNYGTNLPPVLSVPSGDLNAWCIQPAYNFEGSPVGGYTWFVAKGPSDGIQGGLIYYRRVRWNGANAEWVGTWQAASGAYRDYYDIPQGSSFPAPQTVGLGGTGSRLMMAVIRDGTLWTCHHVGLGSNGTYTGGTVDRSGVQVLKLQVSSSALTYSSKERIYDNGSNPYFYHFPSLNVNRPGDFVVGFSGSRTNEFIGAFFTGRRANGTWMTRPGLMQAGRAAYSGGGWGDYSATSCDPTDNSIWTAQMYADPDPDGLWRTWITEISVTQ
ncbi:MAG: hypothetical protein M5U12_06830 [Verrucomicrobia bacterium]|nr:hypothetical protein [Verrucomicrobiota bacterium]